MLWFRRAIVILAALLVCMVGLFYGASELLLRRQIAADLPRITAATSFEDRLEGARLGAVMGCINCHGDAGQGQILINNSATGRIGAPSLAQIAGKASDGQLARAIRNGIGVDARGLHVMPGAALNRLADDDVARLIGWMQTLRTTPFDIVGRKKLSLQGRASLLTRSLPDAVTMATGQSRHRPADIGRYLAETSCAQCHSMTKAQANLYPKAVAPALVSAVAPYDSLAFRTLLRQGRPLPNHAAPVMHDASKAGLNQLSDPEIDALHAWLRAGKGR